MTQIAEPPHLNKAIADATARVQHIRDQEIPENEPSLENKAAWLRWFRSKHDCSLTYAIEQHDLTVKFNSIRSQAQQYRPPQPIALPAEAKQPVVFEYTRYVIQTRQRIQEEWDSWVTEENVTGMTYDNKIARLKVYQQSPNQEVRLLMQQHTDTDITNSFLK